METPLTNGKKTPAKSTDGRRRDSKGRFVSTPKTEEEEVNTPPVVKRKPGRPHKSLAEPSNNDDEDDGGPINTPSKKSKPTNTPTTKKTTKDNEPTIKNEGKKVKPPTKRGRPRKVIAEEDDDAREDEVAPKMPVKKRGRPKGKKNELIDDEEYQPSDEEIQKKGKGKNVTGARSKKVVGANNKKKAKVSSVKSQVKGNLDEEKEPAGVEHEESAVEEEGEEENQKGKRFRSTKQDKSTTTSSDHDEMHDTAQSGPAPPQNAELPEASEPAIPLSTSPEVAPSASSDANADLSSDGTAAKPSPSTNNTPSPSERITPPKEEATPQETEDHVEHSATAQAADHNAVEDHAPAQNEEPQPKSGPTTSVKNENGKRARSISPSGEVEGGNKKIRIAGMTGATGLVEQVGGEAVATNGPSIFGPVVSKK